MRGRGGGTDFSGSSPLCAPGDKGGRVLPLTPPECKQQQMNKTKNTKGQRKLRQASIPGVFAVTTGGLLAAPSTTAASIPGLPGTGHIPEQVQGSELLGQQLTQVTGDRLFAGAQGQAVHLCGDGSHEMREPRRGQKSQVSEDGRQVRGTGRRVGNRECGGTARSSLITHLGLGIGLQPKQTPHLQGFRLDDSSTHEVLRVRVHIVQ